ncbi:MAG: hypothetical protein GX801_06040 [Fibrobacter sp.]|nr:hypothetical protein [Fibrobacter sp.]
MDGLIVDILHRLLSSDLGTIIMVLIIVGISVVSKYFEEKAARKKATTKPVASKTTPPVLPTEVEDYDTVEDFGAENNTEGYENSSSQEVYDEEIYAEDDFHGEVVMESYSQEHQAPPPIPEEKPASAPATLADQYEEFMQEQEALLQAIVSPPKISIPTPAPQKVAAVKAVEKTSSPRKVAKSSNKRRQLAEGIAWQAILGPPRCKQPW